MGSSQDKDCHYLTRIIIQKPPRHANEDSVVTTMSPTFLSSKVTNPPINGEMLAFLHSRQYWFLL